ncbi:hypothetical protein LTR84_008678 [Exophiala bonariae]|uniref:Nephrocystin 3-like N-terminal domain-containing protein n=1 Tax=Exophiala bonariae TaxID=1690606 RepID=A0AAV9MZB6_9EURO|nr:hypothetical protein LTR84_008678 [Exophiala bonariae]
MATSVQYKPEDYTIGWICALAIEFAASAEMLDEEHPTLTLGLEDENSYIYGKIGDHNVVIGCLPAGRIGLVSAATVAMRMKASFKSIRLGLMVGVGGGVPSDDADIRLGDVVVSKPYGQHGGVVQYDMGKRGLEDHFLRTGALNAPPQALLTATTHLEAAGLRDKLKVQQHLAKIARNARFVYPQKLEDKLYEPQSKHVDGKKTCKDCNADELVERDERDSNHVVIHYGTIASGNAVLKDGLTRDRLHQELGGVLCFEMEAAGLINSFPCSIIRGICDYSDSHKNKGWQPYAAATAAAVAKELLTYIPAATVATSPTVDEVMVDMKDLVIQVSENVEIAKRVEMQVSCEWYSYLQKHEINFAIAAEDEKILQWLSQFDFSNAQNVARTSKALGTGQWFLEHRDYIDWRDSYQGLLWLHGVGASTIIRDLELFCLGSSTKKVAYWYFQFSDLATQDVRTMVRSLIRQLSTLPLHPVVRKLSEHHKDRGSQPSMEELNTTLDAVVRAFEGEIYIAIDALDECPETEIQSERAKSLNWMASLTAAHAKNLHLLATGRWEPDIRNKLRDVASRAIDIAPLLNEDINQYVTAAIKEQGLSRWGQDTTSRIAEKLLSVNEPRFRWADLQIKRLKRCPSEDSIWAALESIPKSLEATYQETLEKIDDDNRDHLRKILMWLTYAYTPLSLAQVAAIVGYPFTDDVLRICTSLLVTIIDDESGENHEHAGDKVDNEKDYIIKLAHFSVKEFLVFRQLEYEGLLWFRFSAASAHSSIARGSISYLVDPKNYLKSKRHVDTKPLAKYAARFWPEHYKEARSPGDNTELQQSIELLFSPKYSRSFSSSLLAFDPEDEFHYSREHEHRHPQPLYYAAFFGMQTTAEQLFRTDAQLHDREGVFGNALGAAAAAGHIEIVRWLIKHYNFSSNILNMSEVVKHISKNVGEILGALFDAGGPSVLSGDVLMAAGKDANSTEKCSLLLDRLDPSVLQTFIRSVADSWTYEAMQQLLDRFGSKVEIEEDILVKAAVNWTDYGIQNTRQNSVLEMLLDRSISKIEHPDKLVQAALASSKPGLARRLADRFGEALQITDGILKAAAPHPRDLKFFLDQLDPTTTITEEVWEGAAKDRESMKHLLARFGSEIEVTEEMLKQAARSGGESIKFLISRCGLELITEDVVKAAAHSYHAQPMEVLLELCGTDIVTEDVVKAAAQCYDDENLTLLLDRLGPDILTQEILAAAASSGANFELVLKEARFDTVNSRVLKKILIYPKSLEMLLNRWGPHIIGKEELQQIVARPWTATTLRDVQEGDEKVTFSEEVLKEAEDLPWDGRMMRVVLDTALAAEESLEDTTPMNEDYFEEESGESGIRQLLPYLDPTFITEEVLRTARWSHRTTWLLLSFLGVTDSVSREVQTLIDQAKPQHDGEALEIIHSSLTSECKMKAEVILAVIKEQRSWKEEGKAIVAEFNEKLARRAKAVAASRA